MATAKVRALSVHCWRVLYTSPKMLHLLDRLDISPKM